MNYLKRAASLLLCALLACTAGCSLAKKPADPGTASSSGGSPEPDESLRTGFLQTVGTDPDFTPAVEPYTIAEDFGNIINREDFSYVMENPELMRTLRENGFLATEGYSEEFYSLYEANRYGQIPNFVTTDSMLHTYHLYFSRLLKGLERDYFTQSLIRMSQTLQQESLAQMQALAGTEWENAALRNAAFFSVGLALLQPDAAIPPETAELVRQELALIDGAGGIAPSPVMNIGGGDGLPSLEEDYSQYIPRSYYAQSEDLSRYFKAMMWYGRLSFRQNDRDQSRSALLMTLAMEDSGALADWESVYTVTSFFVGVSDDPGYYEYSSVIDRAYGEDPDVSKLPKQKQEWNAFMAGIQALNPPAINSIPIYDESIQSDREEAIRAYRFMGQRFTLDASIFQRLIYREVEENAAGDRRMLPSALDIPAAMGSDLAQEILMESGAGDYPNYTRNLTAIRDALAKEQPQMWNGSLYNGWLNMLRPLTLKHGAGFPTFMQNEAWEAKNLNTFLGSWTELKHDSVLYAKQVYAEMGGGGWDEKDDRGYVEPEPVVYARLAELAKATQTGLERYNVLREADRDNLKLLQELSERLQKISLMELENQPLSEEDYELIRSFGGQLEHFWYEALKDASDSEEEIYGSDFPAALITDVATDPNGVVLEVGTGKIDRILVVVPVEGSLRIAQGGIFSFYEFEQPLTERLTDEEWRQMLGVTPVFDEEGNWVDTQVDVPRPEWCSRFLSPSPW